MAAHSCLKNSMDRVARQATSSWDHKESDMTGRIHRHTHTQLPSRCRLFLLAI